jgi:RimJ/RimL family protein N-acetyltransferase
VSLKETPRAKLRLRDVCLSDVPVFFEYQLEPRTTLAIQTVATQSTDCESFSSMWKRMLHIETVQAKTVIHNDSIAGYFLKFAHAGATEIDFYLGEVFRGKDVAAEALRLFLTDIETRPVFARVNICDAETLHILEKYGFSIDEYEMPYIDTQGETSHQVLLRID